MFTMSWDTQPTIKELPSTLERMLRHRSSFHQRSGQGQRLSCQGEVDMSVMFHLTQEAHSSQAGRGHRSPPIPAALAVQQCRASEAPAATVLAVTSEYSTVGERKTVPAHLICQPIYGNIESCQKRQRKHLLWFRVPAFYLGDARDSESVNKQQSEEGI